jgi:hypothetical protein
MAENSLDMGLSPVVPVADVESSLSVADVDEVDCCICISTPRIMLERLGLVLPVSPPSVAVVVVFVLVVSDVVLVDFDVVSSFVSRLDRIWDKLPDPCEPMPAMDMVIASFDCHLPTHGRGRLSKAFHVPAPARENGGIRRHPFVAYTVV